MTIGTKYLNLGPRFARHGLDKSIAVPLGLSKSDIIGPFFDTPFTIFAPVLESLSLMCQDPMFTVHGLSYMET